MHIFLYFVNCTGRAKCEMCFDLHSTGISHAVSVLNHQRNLKADACVAAAAAAVASGACCAREMVENIPFLP